MALPDLGVFEGLGQALKLLRSERGLTQPDVAERTRRMGQEVRTPSLSGYETEKTKPELDTLGRILAAMGVSVEELADALRRVQHGRRALDAGRQPSELPLAPLPDLQAARRVLAYLVVDVSGVDAGARLEKRLGELADSARAYLSAEREAPRAGKLPAKRASPRRGR